MSNVSPVSVKKKEKKESIVSHKAQMQEGENRIFFFFLGGGGGGGLFCFFISLQGRSLLRPPVFKTEESDGEMRAKAVQDKLTNRYLRGQMERKRSVENNILTVGKSVKFTSLQRRRKKENQTSKIC